MLILLHIKRFSAPLSRVNYMCLRWWYELHLSTHYIFIENTCFIVEMTLIWHGDVVCHSERSGIKERIRHNMLKHK